MILGISASLTAAPNQERLSNLLLTAGVDAVAILMQIGGEPSRTAYKDPDETFLFASARLSQPGQHDDSVFFLRRPLDLP